MDNTEFGISGLCGITVLLSLGDNFCTSYLVKLSFIFATASFFFETPRWSFASSNTAYPQLRPSAI